MASGAAATSVRTLRSRSSIPARKPPSLKNPWSMATSKQRRDAGLNSRFRRKAFMGEGMADCGKAAGAGKRKNDKTRMSNDDDDGARNVLLEGIPAIAASMPQ